MIHNKERRCQVGLHNFQLHKDNLYVCERCKFMKLPTEMREYISDEDEDAEIKEAFKNMNVGHQCRDGTINFDKKY